jgi:pimeloyl-ACP methyl ester carboxylesterase
MPDVQIFEPEGRAIPYAVEGKGPAVVLIAGRGLNIAYLGALAHSVAQEDFRVVRIGSRRPAPDSDAAPSMHDFAHDVVDVMDHLGVAHAWVGGHAFGGSVARTVALDHHDRVNGVLLLGVEGAVVADVDPSVRVELRDLDVEAMQGAARRAADLPPLVPGVPVLVIQGTDDGITPPSNGEDLQASAPDRVSVVRVDGGRHLVPATHVGATSWAIEDYLDWD